MDRRRTSSFASASLSVDFGSPFDAANFNLIALSNYSCVTTALSISSSLIGEDAIAEGDNRIIVMKPAFV